MCAIAAAVILFLLLRRRKRVRIRTIVVAPALVTLPYLSYNPFEFPRTQDDTTSEESKEDGGSGESDAQSCIEDSGENASRAVVPWADDDDSFESVSAETESRTSNTRSTTPSKGATASGARTIAKRATTGNYLKKRANTIRYLGYC